MDNIIWIILATAVFIALAGILLVMSGEALTDAREDADNLSSYDQWIDRSLNEDVGPSTATISSERVVEQPNFSHI